MDRKVKPSPRNLLIGAISAAIGAILGVMAYLRRMAGVSGSEEQVTGSVSRF